MSEERERIEADLIKAAAIARHESYCPWCPDSECLGLGWTRDIQYVEPILNAVGLRDLVNLAVATERLASTEGSSDGVCADCGKSGHTSPCPWIAVDVGLVAVRSRAYKGCPTFDQYGGCTCSTGLPKAMCDRDAR